MSDSGPLVDRMVRAAKLDSNLYEEVEADTTANWQAFTAVLIVSLAVGIGGALYELIDGDGDTGRIFLSLILGVASALFGWLLWSLVVYVVGITIFKTKETDVDYGQLIRTLGFAYTPGILGFFFFVPGIGTPMAFIGSIWQIVAGVIAVRQAMDFSTGRAVGTCIVGYIPYIVLLAIL